MATLTYPNSLIVSGKLLLGRKRFDWIWKTQRLGPVLLPFCHKMAEEGNSSMPSTLSVMISQMISQGRREKICQKKSKEQKEEMSMMPTSAGTR